MPDLIEVLAMHMSLDDLCEQNDIHPRVVINYLVDEGLIDLEDYVIDYE